MHDIVIFSKDRPPQLDLLLRSVRWAYPVVPNVCVLYRSTNEWSAKGYARIRGCRMVEQGSFKPDFESLLRDADGGGRVCLHCDDDVYVDRVEEPCGLPPDCESLSLRLDRRRWRWDRFPGSTHLGYHASVSNTVYARDDLLTKVAALDYHHPNSLEDALCRVPPKPFGASLGRVVAVNIPANLVQDTHPNDNLGVDQDELNRRFLEGERIAHGPIRARTYTEPFSFQEYAFTPR